MANENNQQDQEYSNQLNSKKTMKIKLKIPIKGNNNTIRICKECGKVFASGKALGGHRRIHVQAARKMEESLRLMKAAGGGGGEEADQDQDHDHLYPSEFMMKVNTSGHGPITCFVCNNGRRFATIKGLYGHMRSHPEREWRGINPPEEIGKFSSDSTISVDDEDDDLDQIDDDDGQPEVVNLMTSLKAWPVTGKSSSKNNDKYGANEKGKGKVVYEAKDSSFPMNKVNEISNSSKNGQEDKFKFGHDVAVMSKLLWIANEQATGIVLFEDKDSSFPKKEALGISNLRKMVDVGAIRHVAVALDRKVDTAAFLDHSSNRQLNEDYKISGLGRKIKNPNRKASALKDMDRTDKKMKMKKKRKLADLEYTGQLDHSNKYPCKYCKKSFSVQKALSGHMACHFRFKKVVADDELKPIEEISPKKEANNDEEGVHDNKHRCEICNKTFPTGQALGGHKRGHWTITSEVQAPNSGTSQITSSWAELGFDEDYPMAEASRVIRDFDLNFPAPSG
ncbi:hypothetical protein ACFE04_023071 [Oxalis oulophora]